MEELKTSSATQKLFDLNGTFDFSFSDLIDVSDLQQLITHLSELAGCGIAIIDLNDKFLASAGLQKICTCFHRVHPETKKHCYESDLLIEQNLKTKNPIAYKCKNGLWDVAYPIFIGEKYVANIFFGQFFFDDEKIDVAAFERQADKYGFDKTEYLNYLQEVPVISRKKVETLKHFNVELARIITQTGYSKLLLKKEKIEELRLANEQIKESELKFRKLFELSGVGVAQVDVSTGMFINVNKKLADMLGYSIDEMLHLSFKEVTYPDDLNVSLQNQTLLIKKQVGEFSIEKRYKRKDGSMLWGLLTASSMGEMPEDKNYQIAIVKDITERKNIEKKLKEEYDRFRSTMDAMDTVVYVADFASHEILFINKYVKDLFGDITGKKCYSALQGKTEPCSFCTNHLLIDDYGKANDPYVWEFQNLITKRWYQCHDQAIQWTSGNLVRFEIATDITKNKENEIKLQELNATKDKFFSIISHDLKNPFAGLLSSCELLELSIAKQDMDKIKKYSDSIYRSSKDAYSLLENLLNWSILQSGKFEEKKVKFNIHSVISNAIMPLQSFSNHKGVEIIITGNQKAEAFFDLEMFKTLIRNFTSNAIKFSTKGEKIYIEINESDKKYFNISIKDNGIGINEEDLKKLFRIDVSHKTYGTNNEIGSGLGLILCKDFIEKNGSEIVVESEVGKGSTFSFTVEKVAEEN